MIMALMEGERFGKVHITSLGEHQKTISGATFSNVDLFWYSLDGEIHNVFEKFRGQPFYLGFNLQSADINGGSVLYQGKLLSPLVIGENRGNLDIDNLDRATKVATEMAIKLKIIKSKEDPKAEILGNWKAETFQMFMIPGMNLSETKLLQYTTAFVLTDDILTDISNNGGSAVVSDFLHGGKLTYTQLIKLSLELMCEPLRGNSVGFGDIMSAVSPTMLGQLAFKETKELYSHFDSTQECLSGIRDEALKLTGGLEERVKPFFQEITKWVESASFERSLEFKEWRNKQSGKESGGTFQDVWMKIQDDLHASTSGAIVLLEALALEKGIFLDDRIRNSPLFRKFLEHFAIHFSKVKQIMSYQKQIESSKISTWNTVYGLQQRKGFSLKKALDTVTDIANKSLQMVLEIGERLVNMHGCVAGQNENENDIKNGDANTQEGVEAYVTIAKDILCAHIQWCALVDSYHTNIFFDCYL